MEPLSVQHVGIVGGGTAGYLTALALRARVPQLRVTLIESSKIPIIGVGEATTPLMLSFLHQQLGIDVVDFTDKVQPTWKLGIRFEWGPNRSRGFNYPFGGAKIPEALAYQADLDAASFTARLMTARRAPLVADGQLLRSLLPTLKFAYHLDNRRFVHYLTALARGRGVEHLDAVVTEAVPRPGGDGIDRLVLEDGTALQFDLYVDCTGFRSLLLGKALASPFQSFASSLLCDSAVVANVPHDGELKPYTLAESMSAGWCWNIPQVEDDHRGYVFCSAFQSLDDAEREMRAANPGMGPAWSLKFRSGRHQHFWRGNVVGVGNAYGFVEPLESTALHMAIIEITCLCRAVAAGRVDRPLLDQRIGGHWDYLRWFLALHYRFNQAWDTPFWRRCQSEVDIGELAPTVARFREQGPMTSWPRHQRAVADIVFGPRGIDFLLLGQGVPTVVPLPTMPRAAWDERQAAHERLLASALTQADARRALTARPELLRAVTDDPTSWVPRLDRALGAILGR